MGKLARKLDISQIKHLRKKRKNNPAIGLVSNQTEPLKEEKKTYNFDPHISPELRFDSKRAKIEKIIDKGLSGSSESAKVALSKLKNLSKPYLNWAGKAERTSFEVPIVSLHTHEKIDPRAVIERVRKTNTVDYEQQSLFKKEKKLSLSQAIDFYQHDKLWKNRLIAGDSLLVMNSLLEKEGMGGKVQCVYIDPPYGIKYGSNFQPFTNKRYVIDKKDEDLTAEPEMLKAFSDTWKLGIHSYLSYLRDRLLLTKELLTESGSCFVQISDENVHLVRNLMDEIFGRENFISQITFRTKNRPMNPKHLEQMCDFALWYSKNKNQLKYRRLYLNKNVQGNSLWKYIGFPNGSFRKLTKEEIDNHSLLEKDFKNKGKIFRSVSIEPVGKNESRIFSVKFKGKDYKPSNSWKYNKQTINELIKKELLISEGRSLQGKYFLDFYPVQALTIPWNDTNLGNTKRYVVQTAEKTIERCLLMTTDPGDLVFDPTCGSGTTAYVAEKWGRRWITCDTSRVAITLAKQRLITAQFDYYKLKNKDEGVSSGFQYKTVPHITLGSIANNESPKEEVLYDQPKKDNIKARVTGPFTVEAVPSQTVLSPGEDKAVSFKYEWLEEVKKSSIRGKKGITSDMAFANLERLKGFKFLHAEGTTTNPRTCVISFGPEHAPMNKRHVESALKEITAKEEKPDILIFASFHFDPSSARLIDEYKSNKTKAVKIQMNMDLQTYDLKKKRSSDESFWLVGSPDVDLTKQKKDEYTVEVKGWDYYNPATGKVEPGGKSKIALWMLDTDYDGRAVFPRQVFFPMAGKSDGWAKLAKSLKSEIDQDLIEQYRGTVSLPFKKGEHKKIAVKIIDDRGIESLKVMDFPKIKGKDRKLAG